MDEAAKVVARLSQIGKTLATAESCTGGLIGKLMTDVPGSSAVYPGGVISYCNRVKHQLLGVSQALLDREGAVCAEVALQMAKGVQSVLGADYGVSTTGVAGPGSDSCGNPPGLVYVAAAGKGSAEVIELHLSGSRDTVRQEAAVAAFSLLLRLLDEETE